MHITKRSATFALALAGLAAAAPAGAQTTVTGTTFGCFGVGCNPAGSSSATFAIPGSNGASIQFTGSSFSGTTNPVTNAFSVGSFGSFVLNGLSGSTSNAQFNTPFTLLFSLSSPAGASSPTTTLAVSGAVGNVNGQGFRDIAYAGGATGVTFTAGSGAITVNGDAIGVNANQIGGRVMATTTAPEPSSYALLATGFVGLAAAVVRRRSASA